MNEHDWSEEIGQDTIGFGGCQCPDHAEVVFDADAPSKAEQRQIVRAIREITSRTVDRTPGAATLRALAVYRRIVEHVAAGGQVKFVGGARDRTLKVRMR